MPGRTAWWAQARANWPLASHKEFEYASKEPVRVKKKKKKEKETTRGIHFLKEIIKTGFSTFKLFSAVSPLPPLSPLVMCLDAAKILSVFPLPKKSPVHRSSSSSLCNTKFACLCIFFIFVPFFLFLFHFLSFFFFCFSFHCGWMASFAINSRRCMTSW